MIVEGEEGYRQAKDFMRLLMPAHARRVKQYADAVPLFQRAHVEDQLAAMYNPVVQLKSGGYLVINPTEALVSIDINSGRSTREHNIEQTATATNLEAAQEIARQLRLRDMAGLVVIDFIDMDNNSNVRKVEKAMKEALKNDRARIQVGRISSFGLMEMSRQRLRTGVLEASTRPCPHCEGTGLVRTASSSGLSALRLIEDEAARGRGSILTLRASQEAAVYVLNRKRADIAEIEDRYGVTVEIIPDREEEGARMTVEASGPPPAYAPKIDTLLPVEEDEDDLIDEVEEEEEDEVEEEATEAPRPRESRDEGDGNGRKRRRRRRGRRNRGEGEGTEPAEGEEHTDAEQDGAEQDATDAEESVEDDAAETVDATEAEPREGGRRRRGRRGRRGGRRGEGAANDTAEAATDAASDDDASDAPLPIVEPIEAGDAAPVTTPLAVAEAEASDAQDPPPSARPQGRAGRQRSGRDAGRRGSACAGRPVAEVEAEAPAKPSASARRPLRRSPPRKPRRSPRRKPKPRQAKRVRKKAAPRSPPSRSPRRPLSPNRLRPRNRRHRPTPKARPGKPRAAAGGSGPSAPDRPGTERQDALLPKRKEGVFRW